MCGIFALANYLKYNISDTLPNTEYLKGKGRGPEFSTIKSVSIDLLFGFHRLAINGLNKKSNQPITIDNVTLICNGEIYNYKELYNDLNIVPSTDSDCEVIIHLYNKFGIEKTLALLDGVFALVLVDNDTLHTKMFVARDPYGVRPLYIMHNNTENTLFGFASEMKMLNVICDTINSNDEYTIDYFQPGSYSCLLYTSPSPRDGLLSRMPSSA